MPDDAPVLVARSSRAPPVRRSRFLDLCSRWFPGFLHALRILSGLVARARRWWRLFRSFYVRLLSDYHVFSFFYSR
jgi:hypothetical protein